MKGLVLPSVFDLDINPVYQKMFTIHRSTPVDGL